MTRALRLAGALAASVSLLAGAGTAAAGAATLVDQPCGDFSSHARWSEDPANASGWYQDASCPDTFSFSDNLELHAGDAAATFYLENYDAPIEGFSGFIQHADPDHAGLQLELRACRYSSCGRAVTGDESPANGYFDVSREGPDPDAEIPAGANRLVAKLTCVADTCPAGTPVLLDNLSLTRSDDTPPIMLIFPTELVYAGDPTTEYDDIYQPSFEPPKWTNGRLRFGWQDADPESRVSYLRFDIEDVSQCVGGEQQITYVEGCEIVPPYLPPDIRASDLTDGHHTLTGTAYNAAGLSASATMEVKTDVTAPARPAQFKLTPRFNGWVGSRDVRIDWTNSGETTETDTQSGIVGYRYDVSPVTDGDNPPPADAVDPPEQYVSAVAGHSLQYRFPSAGDWTVSIVTVDAAGNESGPGEVFVAIDDTRLAAPAFEPIPPINAADAAGGRTISWTYDSLPASGLCGHDYAFNASATFNPGEDPASPTLPGPATELSLTPQQIQALPERPQRFNIRGYSCAGVPGDIAHPQVVVDFTAPSISLAPAGGTVGTDDPVLIGANDTHTGTVQSGVASVVCTINGSPVDCSTADGVGLAPGFNHLVVTATDAAGNSTSTTADYLADSTAPEGWFEQPDPGDPTLVRATARDLGSGLAFADIEFQPVAGGTWTSIGSAFAGDSPGSDPVTLSARIPDDGRLADGEYRLRLRLRDAGGQASTVTWMAGGGDAGFSVPVRSTSVLSARLSRFGSARQQGLERLKVRYGEKTRIAGRLTLPSGAPIAGATLSLTAIQAGAPPRTVGSATTAADGSYTIDVAPGASRSLTVRFAGNLVARPTTADTKLLVTGKISLRASRRAVRSGRKLILRGKVYTAGAALPLRGKSVELEFTLASGGRLTKEVQSTDAAGRFAVAFSYPARGRPVRFSVRARATAEAGWPFEPASSPRVRFVVRP